MYKVNYTTPAQEDLVSIMKYISSILKAPTAAEDLLDKIEKETEILEENPLIFPFSQDEYITKHGIRYMLIKNYFIFYTIDEDSKTVSIIRIMYARRDWINLLGGCSR
ncbi:MAG: type II toxin-antitoxin system RelE/ParE family toxin [Spirochaetales bacterium]|jgi:toxin ParE1/3/4|nr:type II toxin-antitoxin system RelE/ParE family toxin [Spirochaetales bacterium]